MKKEIMILIAMGMIMIAAGAVSAADEQSVCCEKTTSGLYCQDVPASQCASDSRAVPTACESTSYCKAGTCYDSSQGTCLDNTPQIVCNSNNGTWAEKSPAQCQLGCCILGDQASFVTLVRCKKLSSFLGLETNYKSNVNDEVSCVLSVQNQEKGACVFEQDFERTCKITTRADCVGQGNTGNSTSTGKKQFFKGKLCSAEELGTKCGPTRETTCLPGKDEVYFVDSCGNPANIYDSSKINDKEYWTNMKDKSEACSPNSANANSASCGNCNYLQGSYCRKSVKGDAQATYGGNICQDLNCKNTQNGKSYKHGESWCVYNDEGTQGEGSNAVGSRFFKHICINGEEVLEQCADFRQEECIEDSISTSSGTFSQAACRVNRWQDCLAQTEKIDCENTDRRDCLWTTTKTYGVGNSSSNGLCVPKNTPGLKFWEGEEAKQVCAQGNAKCIVVFEKGLFGGEKCKENCQCLTDEWTKERADICMSLGDCGPKINWIGEEGYKPGYKQTVGKVKSEKK